MAFSKGFLADSKNLHLNGGLHWALLFTQAINKALADERLHVSVSAWGNGQTCGLFLHDEIHGKALRVAHNTSAGCGRLIWGASSDFEFPSRDAKESIIDSHVMDFHLEDLDDAVAFACDFLVRDLPKKNPRDRS